MNTLTRLVVSSVVTHSVFKRFAALSDEDKASVVEKVKSSVGGGEEEAAEEGAEEGVEEGAEEAVAGEGAEEGGEAPDMQGIVDGLVSEVEVIKGDGQITPSEVLGLVDNIVQMVSVLINSKAPRKSKSASREDSISERVASSIIEG